MKRTIIVGSRQSHLALTQTGQVLDQLREAAKAHGHEVEFEVKKIVTKGDKILDVTLSKVGGKGLFVKEIELAMLEGEIDMAVHSMKDMPAEFPEELMNAATPKRVDPRDCLISRDDIPLDKLPQGAKIGTSSLRRAAQIQAYRPDLQVEPVRGNIETRMGKIQTEGFDAVILAAAGLHRVSWEDRASELISTDICVPAVGQGALGIECRKSDAELIGLLKLIDDPETDLTVRAERSFLARLNGGCQVPIGAYAVIESGTIGGPEVAVLKLTGIVGTPDGKLLLKETLRGSDPEALGLAMAEKLIDQGADKILEQVRG